MVCDKDKFKWVDFAFNIKMIYLKHYSD